MIKKQILDVLYAFDVLSLLNACVPASGSSLDLAEWHLFSLHITSEDGTQILWEAHADRYRPGATETMRLSVRNNTDGS